MKLYVQQKVFSFKERFTVKNENQEDMFLIEGKVFSFGKQLSIQTMDNNHLALVKQKVFKLLPTFEIVVNEETHVLKKQFSLFTPIYVIPTLNIRIEGDFGAHHYTITQAENELAIISKAFFSFADTYEIDIIDDKYTKLIVAIVVAIDAVLDLESANRRNNVQFRR